MKLITLENEMPVFNPEIRMIKEFNRILMRDRGSEGDSQGRKKSVALKELAFVYFYCVFDSRFDMYTTDDERNEAIRDAVGLPKEWEIDDIIIDAIKAYDKMMQTESMRLVNKARIAIQKFEDYLEDVDLTERNEKSGSLIHDAKKYRENVNGVAEMIKNLNAAKELVEKEIEDKYGASNKNKRRSLIEDENFHSLDTERRF